MFWITLIRIVIWLTFFLLIVQGIGATIWAFRFYRLYMRKHLELEARLDVLERSREITKEPLQ